MGQFGGQFGGNDYVNVLMTPDKSLEHARSYVPAIVDTISNGVERLIHHGARYVVVADIVPAGCMPITLSILASSNKAEDYDRYGCLKSLNRWLSQRHNSLLRRRVKVLRGRYPHARIAFSEHYRLVVAFLQDPDHFGFNGGSAALIDCCGGGGPYNQNSTAPCGSPGATACADPSKAINWDGFHLTDSAYSYIAQGWLHGPYADPPILHLVD